jgi:hypothetical protein
MDLTEDHVQLRALVLAVRSTASVNQSELLFTNRNIQFGRRHRFQNAS